jgi:hypothetical protein
MKLFKQIFLVSSLLLVLTASCKPQAQDRPPQKVNQDALIQQDFQNRVAEYVKLHKTVEAELPKLKPTDLPAKIAEHEHELARRIREARQRARQGDVFTAEIGGEFHRLIGITMRGSDAARIQQSLRSAEPVRLQLRVNDEYPASIPLQSTPPTLLENLPKLPPEVDYRVAGHDLLLRDVGANIIVDFMTGAIP